MRVRKIHAVLAVSVALALVAYSMEARRREDDDVADDREEILTASLDSETVEVSEPVEVGTAQTEPLTAIEESPEPSVADQEPQVVEESPEVEPDSRAGRRRAPLLTAAVLVLVVVAGAFLAVEAIASTAHHATLLQHH